MQIRKEILFKSEFVSLLSP